MEVGTVLRLERNARPRVKRLRQATQYTLFTHAHFACPQRDAFLLFTERIMPELFGGEERTSAPCSPDGQTCRSSSGLEGAVRDEENWSRTRRNVPLKFLESLLTKWKRGEGLSPAEYGALRVEPSRVRNGVCVSFLTKKNKP